jgi:hypothetical protein
MTQSNFLNRWARKKAGVIEEPLKNEPPQTVPNREDRAAQSDSQSDTSQASPQKSSDGLTAPPEVPPLTMEDVEKIDIKAADFSAFMRADVDPAVQQAAMKKMFRDPHFNVMDGLDIYIDDYSKPDPIPMEMLKRMAQSDMLGIFKTTDELYPEFKDAKKDSDTEGNAQLETDSKEALAEPSPNDNVTVNPNPRHAYRRIDIESSDSDSIENQNQQTGEKQIKPDAST